MAEQNRRHRGLKIAGWVLGALLGVVVLLPLTLYIPWVQNVVKDIACHWASEKTGMDISIGRILVKFPLDVSLDDVLVLDEQRDTMLQAENLTADIAFKPLLDKQVQINEAHLTDGKYRLVTEDSSMVLNTAVRNARFEGVGIDLQRNRVNVTRGALRGGDVTLSYYADKVVHEPDTAQTDPWQIRAHTLTLDDVNYRMDMMPTIDDMTTHIGHAELKGGFVDTGAKTVNVRTLGIDSADVRYYYPDEVTAQTYSRAHPVPVDTFPPNPADSVPWIIRADSLRLTAGYAVYARRDAKPMGSGLDTDCIEVSDLNLAIDDFYNRGSEVVVPVRHLSARERSGLAIEDGSGTVTMNDLGLDLNKIHVKTSMSDLSLDGHVDADMLSGKPGGNMNLTTDSKIAVQDIARALPSLAPTLKDIPQSHPISVNGTVSGNTGQVNIKSLTVDMPRYAHATVSGQVLNPTDTEHLAASLDIDAKFDNINWVKPTLMDKALQNDVNLPPMDLKGKIQYDRGNISADAAMRLQGGELVGKGTFNSDTQCYDVDATFNQFPVKAILPGSDTDRLTAHIRANGQGLDFLDPKTSVNAEVDLAGVCVGGTELKGLRADVSMRDGEFAGQLTSTNPDCSLTADVTGRISGDHYVIDAHGKAKNVDLKALKLYEGDGACKGSTQFDVSADVDLKRKEYDATVSLNDISWQLGSESIVAENANATLQSAPGQGTHITFDNEDNHIRFDSEQGLDPLIEDFTHVSDVVGRQVADRRIDIDTLRRVLPKFEMSAQLGTDGVVQRYMQNMDIDFRSINLQMSNDSTIYLDGTARGLTIGEQAIDTLTLHANELENKYLAFKAHMGNRRGTWDDMAQVSIEGGIKGPTVDFLLRQQNINLETGYRVGCNATLTDTAVNARFFPSEPIIGYRQWRINDGNYVNYNLESRMLDADLDLSSGDSKVRLLTQRSPGASNEDIKLDIENLKIEEWTQLLPALAGTKGVLNADLDLGFDGKNVDGEGKVSIKDFVYGGQREGDIELNTRFTVDPATASTRLDAEMLIDGGKVALAYGVLNDSTQQSPLSIGLELQRFPLNKANPFVPGDNMVRLRGYANGTVTLTGSTDAPVINGRIVGDSASVTLPRYGMELRMSDDSVAINNSRINFNKFRLYGLNDRPVSINGNVDFSDLDNMGIDLTLHGENVQVMGCEQKPWSEMFGKAFVDIDGTVRTRAGNTSTAIDLTLLPSSNITYVMKDEVELKNQVDENMVTFVNLKDSVDTTPILKTASASGSNSILANINVEQGAKIGVYLSEDGKDHASVDGSGRLKYSLDFAGKDKLTGTYTIESGSVRYTPPIVSQKNFDIASGSSVQWTGDMLNPQLNLSATERLKTSVSGDDGASRLVEFLITAHVGGTLNNLELSFDMGSEGDMTVQNELQSMSTDQRSQAAINLLLYNTYSGTNSAGKINNLSASGALFSFLQSQINDWASKAIKGVDISFGINQYEGTRTGGVQTSYSYRLAKNLFNERFKIVVGGEYSTDATAEENFSQNLISDVSLEYLLNNSGSKYVRMFRHTGYESMLEGQVTETGVGYVMKRKVDSLDQLFRKSISKSAPAKPDSVATEPDTLRVIDENIDRQ